MKEEMKNYGFIINNETYKSPVHILNELKYLCVGIVVEIAAVPFLLTGILFVFLKDRFFKGKNRILFGTSSIVSLKEMKSVLHSEFDIEYFVFRDNSMPVKGVVPITPFDLCPHWVAQKYPILICKYISFIWALLNFRVFVFYFDGGFLDRTFLLWRFEPIVYQLLGRKFALFPYGADVWDSRKNLNMLHKYGHLSTYLSYFNEDFKREKRIYWWCKYANMVFAPVDYIQYIPRADILTLTGQVLDIESYPYTFNENSEKIKILHFANQGSRKGTRQIKHVLKNICLKHDHVEYRILEGVSRNIAMDALKECHIFIDNLMDGFISYSSIEGMLSGKIVLTNLDSKLTSFYKNVLPEYYNEFDKECPVREVNPDNFEDVLNELICNQHNFQMMSHQNRNFALKIINDNTIGWKNIFTVLLESRV